MKKYLWCNVVSLKNVASIKVRQICMAAVYLMLMYSSYPSVPNTRTKIFSAEVALKWLTLSSMQNGDALPQVVSGVCAAIGKYQSQVQFTWSSVLKSRMSRQASCSLQRCSSVFGWTTLGSVSSSSSSGLNASAHTGGKPCKLILHTGLTCVVQIIKEESML